MCFKSRCGSIKKWKSAKSFLPPHFCFYGAPFMLQPLHLLTKVIDTSNPWLSVRRSDNLATVIAMSRAS